MAKKGSNPTRQALRDAGSAIRAHQTLDAAAAVIAARAEMAALDAAIPSAATRAEMDLMVSEKVDAFSKAGALVATGVGDMAGRTAAFAVEETLTAGRSLQRLAACANPAEAMLLQSRLASDFLSRSLNFGLALNALATRTGDNALRPIHRAVTANQKRLRAR